MKMDSNITWNCQIRPWIFLMKKEKDRIFYIFRKMYIYKS